MFYSLSLCRLSENMRGLWQVMGKQCGVCTGLPIRQGSCQGSSYCGCQDKAKEWGEERKSLALPVEVKDLTHGEV